MKSKRNEHGDERNGQRENRKADLFGTFEGGLQRRFAFFDVTAEMFSIMTMASSTTKPVEMVSAMSERLFRLKPSKYITPKRADDGERHGNAGDNRGANAAQEKEDNHHDERDSEHQLKLNVFD